MRKNQTGIPQREELAASSLLQLCNAPALESSLGASLKQNDAQVPLMRRVNNNCANVKVPKLPGNLMWRLENYSIKLRLYKKKKRPKRYPLLGYYLEEGNILQAEYIDLSRAIRLYISSKTCIAAL
jgi:hypothetical protein